MKKIIPYILTLLIICSGAFAIVGMKSFYARSPADLKNRPYFDIKSVEVVGFRDIEPITIPYGGLSSAVLSHLGLFQVLSGFNDQNTLVLKVTIVNKGASGSGVVEAFINDRSLINGWYTNPGKPFAVIPSIEASRGFCRRGEDNEAGTAIQLNNGDEQTVYFSINPDQFITTSLSPDPYNGLGIIVQTFERCADPNDPSVDVGVMRYISIPVSVDVKAAIVAASGITNFPHGASCSDGVKNQDETDADCGGVCGNLCQLGQQCKNTNDCVSGQCNEQRNTGSLTCQANPPTAHRVDSASGGVPSSQADCASGTVFVQASPNGCFVVDKQSNANPNTQQCPKGFSWSGTQQSCLQDAVPISPCASGQVRNSTTGKCAIVQTDTGSPFDITNGGIGALLIIAGVVVLGYYAYKKWG
jgi:hypothetical protein